MNIKETKEFTISIVTSKIVEQVSLASCSYNRDVDEFIKSGLNKHQSKIVMTPGVVDSPFIMECKLHKIIDLGGKPASGNLILGKVVMFHVNENILDQSNKVNPVKIDQVGRSGGSFYVETKKSLFSINKPNVEGIGFDMIPKEILNSNLSGNNLAKLAGVSRIPNLLDLNMPPYKNIKDCISDVEKLLSKNKVNDAWQLILNWISKNE